MPKSSGGKKKNLKFKGQKQRKNSKRNTRKCRDRENNLFWANLVLRDRTIEFRQRKSTKQPPAKTSLGRGKKVNTGEKDQPEHEN